MFQALIGPVTGLLDKFIEDKDQKNKLAHEIATMADKHSHEIAKAQIEVNKEEAKSRSWWIAGWRPACGWICTLAMGYHFIIQPFLIFFLALFGMKMDLPSFDMDTLMTVLLGMLGLGGLRSFEKHKKLTK
jgi:phenylpyruvate tautomerase PptA (4-oxalocrotonate tautomerase family)|tara:strand:+ start:1290 stop:1682 length:393 start_codon:yes stop_codon:yes gene_type:complete